MEITTCAKFEKDVSFRWKYGAKIPPHLSFLLHHGVSSSASRLSLRRKQNLMVSQYNYSIALQYLVFWQNKMSKSQNFHH